MNALVVYESMFGNTRTIAEAIADGLRSAGVDVTVSLAYDAPADLSDYALVVVGAPTHAHGLPRTTSRNEAVAWAADPAKNLLLEPMAQATGVREWLARMMLVGDPHFAVFSTRADIPWIFSGDACKAIAKGLRKRLAQVDSHSDFLVGLDNRLVEGEETRAREWANGLVPLPIA
ncbi:flavodoxin domain-containing protein [Microbacterium sp. 2FI]|uniref:flavodoxin family protein n=1 Tax=Microbacterium sp. 2FI TaxID=2502193 RepID=UPI0010F4B88D|nr:flavodoxin domain-containing protein [Microbacterium sp. 2FI]